MLEHALRTRIRVHFPEGTVIELDRDPARAEGDLVPPGLIGCYWSDGKFQIVRKEQDPASDIEPGEIRYFVQPF